MGDEGGAWDGYVARFHDREAGITEDLLGRTDHDGADPYAWCVAPLADRPGPVVDLACGSGPVRAALGPERSWVGLDTSPAELARARGGGRRALARASATALPLRAGASPSLSCAMGLQVIEPLDPALAELARTLAPGGRAVLLLPSAWPLGLRDLGTYLRLQVALRQVIRYPNGTALAPRRLAARVEPHGLAVTSDEQRAFALTVDHTTADLLVRSLYLPGTSPERRARGRAAVAGRAGSRLAIPLRRVVLDRS